MPAPVVVQSGGAAHWDSGPDTNIIVTLGTTPTPGNLMVFVVGDVRTGATGVPDWDAMRSGITQHGSAEDTSGDGADIYVATYTAAASESSTYTITSTRSGGQYQFDSRFLVLEVSGADTSSPIDAIATQDHAFINPLVFPSVSTTVADTLHLMAVCERNNPGDVAGTTKYGAGFDSKTSAFARTQAAAGATGSFSSDTFGYGSQAVFAIAPAGGAPIPPLTAINGELSVSGSGTLSVMTAAGPVQI